MVVLFRITSAGDPNSAEFIGDHCRTHEECEENLGEHSFCHIDETCLCLPRSIPSGDRRKCLKKAEHVGDDCTEDPVCTTNLGELSKCNLASLKCACIPGAISNPDKTKCIPGSGTGDKLFIGKSCSEDAQCVGDTGLISMCTSSGICGCRKGYISAGKLNDCLLIRDEIGAMCTENQQCQQGEPGPFSHCLTSGQGNTGVCNCTSDAISEAEENRCHPKVKFVGEDCVVNAQCIVNLDHSFCLSGKCYCLPGSTPSEDFSKCNLKL